MKFSYSLLLLAPLLAQAASSTSSSKSASSSSSSASSSSTAELWTDDTHLQGTWSSKSQMVLTGPNFYDPVDELLIEPALPGISYSFRDGWFEMATYEITANPKKPQCPTGSLVFQHGTYEVTSQGNITMTPIAVDGRMLLSEPCGSGSNASATSTYMRYSSQKITMQSFRVEVDNYHGRYRLSMFAWDGSPLAPMYLVYRPAQMLPTMTLNPTDGASVETSASTGAVSRLRKRAVHALENRSKTTATRRSQSYDGLWWLGVSLIAAGGVGFLVLS